MTSTENDTQPREVRPPTDRDLRRAAALGHVESGQSEVERAIEQLKGKGKNPPVALYDARDALERVRRGLST